MNIAKIFNETVTIHDQIGEEKYWFKFRKNGLTPNFKQHFHDTQRNPESYAKALASVVTEWDLKLDDEDFPPTEANLRNVPTEFLDRMLEKIAETWSEPSES